MQKLTFQWEINKFFDCDLTVEEFFDSPRFFITDSAFKSDWKLRVYPVGFKEGYGISILPLRLDTGSIFHTKVSISFLNRNGDPNYTKSCSQLRIPSLFTDAAAGIFNLSNIFVVENARRYMDGEVLSIL